MKLTKTQREVFVNDVIRDVMQNEPKEPENRIREIFNIIDEQTMPASILNLKKTDPNNFAVFIEKYRVSPCIIDTDARRYLDSTGANQNLHYLPKFVTDANYERAVELTELVKDSRGLPGVCSWATLSTGWREFAMAENDIAMQLGKSPELVAELIELQIARYRWIIKALSTKEELKSKIAQCRTLAEAKIMFPDLEDYLPEPPVKTAQLPVSPATDVLNALRGLGIPKEEEVAA